MIILKFLLKQCEDMESSGSFFSGLSPAETRVLSQVSSCGIFGVERGTEAGCSSSASVYPG
jgi:hypothetical protein